MPVAALGALTETLISPGPPWIAGGVLVVLLLALSVLAVMRTQDDD